MADSDPIRTPITTSEFLTDVRTRLNNLFRSHSPDYFGCEAAEEVMNEVMAGVKGIGTNEDGLIVHAVTAEDLPGEEGSGRAMYSGCSGGSGARSVSAILPSNFPVLTLITVSSIPKQTL